MAKASEKIVTQQIRHTLKLFGIFHWKVWQGLGSVPGVPDILGIYNGRMLGIEIKAPNGRLSDHQAKFIKDINDRGGIAFVARSVDDVLRELGLQDRVLNFKG